MTICNNCGSEVAAGNDFCGDCGNRIAPPAGEAIVCAACHADNPTVNAYCHACGALLTAEPNSEGAARGAMFLKSGAIIRVVGAAGADLVAGAGPQAAGPSHSPAADPACPNCGRIPRPGTRFCGSCGTALPLQPVPLGAAPPPAQLEPLPPPEGETEIAARPRAGGPVPTPQEANIQQPGPTPPLAAPPGQASRALPAATPAAALPIAPLPAVCRNCGAVRADANPFCATCGALATDSLAPTAPAQRGRVLRLAVGLVALLAVVVIGVAILTRGGESDGASKTSSAPVASATALGSLPATPDASATPPPDRSPTVEGEQSTPSATQAPLPATPLAPPPATPRATAPPATPLPPTTTPVPPRATPQPVARSSSVNFGSLSTGVVSLASYGFTTVPNPTNIGLQTPPGTGALNIIAANGQNQVLPPGTTKEGYFSGPQTTLGTFNTLTCATLSYTGAGSLTSFSVTRVGVSGGGSTPAWQISAYDSSNNRLGATGEGDMSAGGFYFPTTYQTFTLTSSSAISMLVICTHNNQSTYGSVILTNIAWSTVG